MDKWLLKNLLPFFVLFFLASNSFATEEYAGQTGRRCSECHIDAAGGGELTKAGEDFLDDLRIKGLYRPLKQTQKIVRFIIGYFHIMTGIIWFGTILYVHLILKPAYAAKGLPKGELILGWISIIIMALTGVLLTIARIPSWQMLFHTRFGLLLMTKIFLFLVMASTAVTVTFIIGPKLRKRRRLEIQQDKRDLTIEELSQCDGKEGRPACVAYKGIIYNVTNSKLWKDGSHLRKHSAGNDLTEVLKTAPHGEEKILSLPQYGRLLQTMEKPEKPIHEKVFYFFAYMNLILIFLVVFVIALWRWW
ncbi:MAG: CopD family protein [Nitrospirae bacterium]|nr:CopD family protein [Nitrospirota bacterium]